jgi:SAM-dependent methyltransferase
MDHRVEFDHIAPVYDETRGPPSEIEVETLVELLADCRTVLDAGVGTGRFAVPLLARHFKVVGVDLSMGMMIRARAKGITALVRGDLRQLPLKSDSVDAVFTAHVLQLLPDVREVFQEMGRIARQEVVVLLPRWSERDPSTGWRGLRERYRELASELGYPLPEHGKRYHHTLEDLSAIAPPKSVRVVRGPAATASDIGDRLARWEACATLGTPIPPEVHAQIVRRLEAEHPRDTSRWPQYREERFAVWDTNALRGTT